MTKQEYSDKLLDKIHDKGVDSLTSKEMEFLTKFSKGEDVNLDDYIKKDKTKKPNNKFKVRGFEEFNRRYREMGINPFPIPLHEPFKVGDIVIPMVRDYGNIPQHASDFLDSKEEFEILRINDNGKLHLGHVRNVNGKRIVYYFSPNRFVTHPKNNNPIEPNNKNTDSFGDFDNWDDDFDVEKELNKINKKDVKGDNGEYFMSFDWINWDFGKYGTLTSIKRDLLIDAIIDDDIDFLNRVNNLVTEDDFYNFFDDGQNDLYKLGLPQGDGDQFILVDVSKNKGPVDCFGNLDFIRQYMVDELEININRLNNLENIRNVLDRYELRLYDTNGDY